MQYSFFKLTFFLLKNYFVRQVFLGKFRLNYYFLLLFPERLFEPIFNFRKIIDEFFIYSNSRKTRCKHWSGFHFKSNTSLAWNFVLCFGDSIKISVLSESAQDSAPDSRNLGKSENTHSETSTITFDRESVRGFPLVEDSSITLEWLTALPRLLWPLCFPWGTLSFRANCWVGWILHCYSR